MSTRESGQVVFYTGNIRPGGYVHLVAADRDWVPGFSIYTNKEARNHGDKANLWKKTEHDLKWISEASNYTATAEVWDKFHTLTDEEVLRTTWQVLVVVIPELNDAAIAEILSDKLGIDVARIEIRSFRPTGR